MTRETVAGICAEDINHYQDLARQYARKSIAPIFEGEYSDGNLALLPERLKTAFEIGIAAAPDKTFSGCDYGIWGGATDETGPMPSILLLSEIARTCGGAAMCLHAQGVASNIVMQAKKDLPFTPVKAALCLQEGYTQPYLGTIVSPCSDTPAKVETTATANKSGYVIEGRKSFVYSMGETDAYVVFARIDKTWGCFLIGASDAKISRSDVGVRTGLRACRVEHVAFNSVEIPQEARIDDSDARELVIRAMNLNWMGISAVALGIAKGAADAARRYAAERYQGGAQIEEHPAVKMLIGGAESAISIAEATLYSLYAENWGSIKTLKKSAAVKLSVMEHCARAVTDCLQSFGGYGYMEDYGMEKRLRDVTVLKSASGTPTYLKQLIFDIERNGAA